MKRKCLFLFLCFSLFVFAFWVGVWTAWAEGHAHYTPEYAQVNIVPIMQKEQLDEADYELLLQQTGLSRPGVDELRENDRQKELLYLQERYFAEVEMVCLRDNFIVQSERLVRVGAGMAGANVVDAGEVGGMVRRMEQSAQGAEKQLFLPTVQTGDILISFSGHVFGWRNGHAAIVVDAKAGQTLEAITLGSDSRICGIGKWAEYPCFALLRLKGATAEERETIAKYAAENLVGVDYRLFSFAGDSEGTLTGTHCSHLVWSAYACFGYDLDSDGGLVVTPRDIFDSDLLEVVQIYGLNPVVAGLEIK